MRENQVFGPLTLLNTVIEAENEIFEHRQGALLVNLFDSSILKHEDYEAVVAQFRETLNLSTSMRGRLSLFMRRDYLPIVKSLDLGYITPARGSSEQDELSEEFYNLADLLLENDIIQCVNPREELNRSIQFRSDGLVVVSNAPKTPNWSIGDRNRSLFTFQVDNYLITVAKRQTFVMPTELQSLNIEAIEKFIDDKHDDVILVREVYYAKKKTLRSE